VEIAHPQMASLAMDTVFAGMAVAKTARVAVAKATRVAVAKATRVAVEAEGECEALVQLTSRANSPACQEANGLLEATA
jgi:hypothetical protein